MASARAAGETFAKEALQPSNGPASGGTCRTRIIQPPSISSASVPPRRRPPRGEREGPQNTCESFDRAEADGADGIELDVRLTFDGEAVVVHDPEITVGERRVSVAQLTMAELSADGTGPAELRGRVPTLREVLARYGSSGRRGAATVPLAADRPDGVPRRGALFAASSLRARPRPLLLRGAAPAEPEIEPRIETCLNFDASTYRPTGRFWPDRPRGCDAIAPHASLVTPRLMAEARESALSVHVWTVNDPEAARQMALWGAASVISDDPGLVGPAVRAVTGAPPPLELVRPETREFP